MRLSAASIAIGLMLAGAMPAGAAQTAPSSPGANAPAQSLADSSTADRDSYTQQARDKMSEWKKKLHEFGESAEAKGKTAGTSAQKDLDMAWAKANATSDALQVAGSAGWENAKESYESASRKLAEAWQKVHPEDKR